MKKMLLFFSLILLAMGFAISVYAQKREPTCSSVDLREKLPPTRLQGDIGWCYAYAAADLLSFKIGKNVSPISMALNFNRIYLNHTGAFDASELKKHGHHIAQLEGGEIRQALFAAEQTPVCLQNDYSFELAKSKTMEKIAETLKEVESLETQYRKSKSFALSCAQLNSLHSIFPHIGAQELTHMLQKSAATSEPELNFVDELESANCRHPIFLKKPLEIKHASTDKHWKFRSSVDDLIRVLNQELDRNNIVGLSYYFHLDDLKNSSRDDKYGHASVIVGRRQAATGCEYLVRNSMSTCEDYDAKIAKNCDHNNVWVPENILRRDGTDVTFIPK